jgi:hypothetical protein
VDPENTDHSTLASSSTSLSTATDPSTVGASAVPGAESNGTIAEAQPETVPAIEGTVPRFEQSQHSQAKLERIRMDDQHNGGGLPPEETPHVVYPEDPESALHPDIEPPLPRALVSGGGTRTPPPPPPLGR